ncbi:hypothetical protein CBL_03168 [Carabus blaptoides fortunei]
MKSPFKDVRGPKKAVLKFKTLYFLCRIYVTPMTRHGRLLSLQRSTSLELLSHTAGFGNKIKKLKVWRELERVICVNSPWGSKRGANGCRDPCSVGNIGTIKYDGGCSKDKRGSGVSRNLQDTYSDNQNYCAPEVLNSICT